jgi:hypothetical protein
LLSGDLPEGESPGETCSSTEDCSQAPTNPVHAKRVTMLAPRSAHYRSVAHHGHGTSPYHQWLMRDSRRKRCPATLPRDRQQPPSSRPYPYSTHHSCAALPNALDLRTSKGEGCRLPDVFLTIGQKPRVRTQRLRRVALTVRRNGMSRPSWPRKHATLGGRSQYSSEILRLQRRTSA